MDKKHKIFSIIAVVLVFLVIILFVWSNYFIDVKYLDAVYTSENIKMISEESNVEEVQFLVELVNVEDASEEYVNMIFIPFDEDWDDTKGYRFTLKEKIDGQWNDYEFNSFAHYSAQIGGYSFFDRNKSVYCEKYEGTNFVIYADRNSSMFGNELTSIDIEVFRDNQRMYKGKLKIVK